MGNKSPTMIQSQPIQHGDYVLTKQIRDPRMGIISEVSHVITGKKAYLKERINIEQRLFTLLIKEFKTRMNLEHANLLQIYGFSVEDYNTKSITHNKIKIFFEASDCTLAEEISRRKKILPPFIPFETSNNIGLSTPFIAYFEEEKLFNIITGLINGLAFLQANGIFHGDIRTDTIHLSPYGEIKALDRKLIYDHLSNYELAYLGDHETLLSPISLLSLKEKKAIKQNMFKADVFSLGMMLIEVATFEKSHLCYDWNNLELNQIILEKRLIGIHKRYSQKLYLLIREMIRLNEDHRPDFIALKRILEDTFKKNMDQKFIFEKQERQGGTFFSFNSKLTVGNHNDFHKIENKNSNYPKESNSLAGIKGKVANSKGQVNDTMKELGNMGISPIYTDESYFDFSEFENTNDQKPVENGSLQETLQGTQNTTENTRKNSNVSPCIEAKSIQNISQIRRIILKSPNKTRNSCFSPTKNANILNLNTNKITNFIQSGQRDSSRDLIKQQINNSSNLIKKDVNYNNSQRQITISTNQQKFDINNRNFRNGNSINDKPMNMHSEKNRFVPHPNNSRVPTVQINIPNLNQASKLIINAENQRLRTTNIANGNGSGLLANTFGYVSNNPLSQNQNILNTLGYTDNQVRNYIDGQGYKLITNEYNQLTLKQMNPKHGNEDPRRSHSVDTELVNPSKNLVFNNPLFDQVIAKKEFDQLEAKIRYTISDNYPSSFLNRFEENKSLQYQEIKNFNNNNKLSISPGTNLLGLVESSNIRQTNRPTNRDPNHHLPRNTKTNNIINNNNMQERLSGYVDINIETVGDDLRK